jgi:hypothetical protein
MHLAWEQKVEDLLKSGKAAPGLVQFLGVSQIASPRQLFVWEAQTNYMPWATIGQEPVFHNDDNTLDVLTNQWFLPRRALWLSLDARSQVQAGADKQARILSSHIGPSECMFETSAESRTMLVMAQAYYHCWRASVDGADVPLWRANYAFQAVEVPSGRHEVRLVYVDRAFQAGAIISIVALIVCAGLILKFRFKSRRGADSGT